MVKPKPMSKQDKDVVEGEKLIAEFMGEGAGGGYHQSWDWLMPVWVKFRNLGLQNGDYEQWVHSLSWYLYSTTESPYRLFERIVYAIQWYNSQQPINKQV